MRDSRSVTHQVFSALRGRVPLRKLSKPRGNLSESTAMQKQRVQVHFACSNSDELQRKGSQLDRRAFAASDDAVDAQRSLL